MDSYIGILVLSFFVLFLSYDNFTLRSKHKFKLSQLENKSNFKLHILSLYCQRYYLLYFLLKDCVLNNISEEDKKNFIEPAEVLPDILQDQLNNHHSKDDVEGYKYWIGKVEQEFNSLLSKKGLKKPS